MMMAEDPVESAKRTLKRTQGLADFASQNRMRGDYLTPKTPTTKERVPAQPREQPRSMRENVSLRRALTGGRRK
jgi:hypothetical protein